MKQKSPNGFAVIFSLLILAAVGVVISTSLLYMSVANTQTAVALQSSYQASDLANACAETALQKLVTSSAFVGTGSLTLGQGTCSYTIAANGASADKVTASGTVGTVVRKVEISIAVPQLVIFSWQEVGNFY